MSKISIWIIVIRFLQLVGSVVFFAGLCIEATAALSNGPNIFAVALVVGLAAFLATVAMTVHSIWLRLRPHALREEILSSARSESRRALRVLLDFFMTCMWVGAVLADILMPYYIIYGNQYRYSSWTYRWEYLYIGRAMAWLTATIVAGLYFVTMWLVLAETLRSKKLVPIELSKVDDEEEDRRRFSHGNRVEVPATTSVAGRVEAPSSASSVRRVEAPSPTSSVGQPEPYAAPVGSADYSRKAKDDLPPSYDFKN